MNTNTVNVRKYIAPTVEIVDIEIDQSILADPSGMTGDSTGSLQDMEGSYW